MGQKFVIYFSLFLFSGIGGWLPTLWHADIFSLWSIILSAVGGFLGIYIGIKVNNAIGG